MASILIEDQYEIPLGIHSLEEFRAWTRSEKFPERGRIDYIDGQIEVDMQAEELHSHGGVKVELVIVLGLIVKQEDLGELFTDRTRVASTSGVLSCEPDIVFLSHATIASPSTRLVTKSGHDDRFVEIEGAPDLVVEIVSDSSVAKDTRRLPHAYFQAGIAEYWIIDARGEDLQFQIFERGREAFEPVPQTSDGFQHSNVLQRQFSLSRSRNRHGHWTYDLNESKKIEN